MADNYVVNYDINVRGEDAIQALNKFQTATANLTQATQNIQRFEKELNNLFARIKKNTPVLNISTKSANQALDITYKKIQKIHALAKETAVLGGFTQGGGSKKTSVVSTGGGGSKGGEITTSKPAPRQARVAPMRIPKINSYQVLGHTMLDTGGVGILDFAKGMGIAYGLAGMGSLISKTVKDATEYDNLIATARNILGTHDKDKGTFGMRFAQMEKIIRNVGVQTKFTAPQVADAAKFLAMAGMDVNAINHAISPIADIALVGDTDLGETADVVTNIMTGYGIKPEGVRRAADIMTMTFTKSNTTLLELAEAYKYSASLLSAGSIDFEESAAAIGVLGNAGIKGSQAGTTMRTIMANIVNPTKKQLTHWKKIGVSRIDKYGNVRSLADIFQDLHDKDLFVQDFYKLFHKTAAQGAVSLARNIDIWNDIIRANFLSDGLAAQLADEKKNTIQGLWYQLTSAFTETGMQVFEEQNSPIREVLRGATNWLKGGDAKKMMRDVGSFAVSLLDTLKTFSSVLFHLYERFGPLIKFWMQFQLYATLALVPLRTMKAIMGGGGFLVSAAIQTGKLATQFGILGAKAKVATTQVIQANNAANATGTMLPASPARAGQLDRFMLSLEARRRKYARSGLVDRFMRMNPNYLWSGAIGTSPTMAGFAGMFGTIAGAYGGSYLAPEGSDLGILTSLIGSVGGGALAMKAVPWIATLFSNPITWIVAATAAVAGGAYAWYKYAESTEEAANRTADYLGLISNVNGINYSEHATMADKYLQIVYNKQLDVNGAIQKHVDLMKEQLGIMADIKKEADKTPFKESHKNEFDDLSKPYSGWNFLTKGNAKLLSLASQPIKDKNGNVIKELGTRIIAGSSDNPYKVEFNGMTFQYGFLNDNPEILAAARYLYAKGRDTSEGTELDKIKKDLNSKFLKASSVEELESLRSQYMAFRAELLANIIPGSERWTMTDIGDNSWETNQRGYHYVTGMVNEMDKLFNWDNPQSANANFLKTFKDVIGLRGSGQQVPKDLVYKLLALYGIDAFNTERGYGEFGTNEFLSKWGWNGSMWLDNYLKIPRKDNKGKIITDENGNPIMYSLSGEQARQAYLGIQSQIKAFMGMTNTMLWPLLTPFANHASFGYINPTKNTNKNGDKIEYNGETWTFKDGKWRHPKNGTTMSSEAMNKALISDNDPFGGPGKQLTPDPSQYKNQYQSTNAAPKQVIVKIENLMNVESVDLSNPENTAVVANLKGQLAQALIDVVHDFDNTYHG